MINSGITPKVLIHQWQPSITNKQRFGVYSRHNDRHAWCQSCTLTLQLCVLKTKNTKEGITDCWCERIGVQSFKIWFSIDSKMLCAAPPFECDSNHNCLAQDMAKANTNTVAFSHLLSFLCHQMQDIFFLTAKGLIKTTCVAQ